MQLQKTFTPKALFLKKLEDTEFLADRKIKLQEIFIFPQLSSFSTQTSKGIFVEDTINSADQLLSRARVLVHGEELSGKTALCRYLLLKLISTGCPALYLDLKEVSGQSVDRILREAFHSEFSGSYDIWKSQDNKTLILDNLTSSAKALNLLVSCKNLFERIIVLSSTDVFASFFKDEARVADFHITQLQPLSHVQQETLIRQRLNLSGANTDLKDGVVDQIEDRVNAIVISNKIVPRYPFFVLSILQTYEGYMPEDISISLYGHCYHALIVAMLIKSGIQKSDSDINTCFNFAEHLAFDQYWRAQKDEELGERAFEEFLGTYKEKFILPIGTLNRMRNGEYGLITNEGEFRNAYMYYFFLGRFLARNSKCCREYIQRICEEGHVGSNHLILLFTIHHTNDDELIEDIMLRAMCTLDQVQPAVLDESETRRFLEALADMPGNVLSDKSVSEERGRQRKRRDMAEGNEELDFEDEGSGAEFVNDVYRVLKSNKVLGQILRNKFGSLTLDKIEEIVEVIVDGGLRLVNSALADEEEIRRWASNIAQTHPRYGEKRIETMLRVLSFVWTMVNLEAVVAAINVPEIQSSVMDVVKRKGTPAYEFIGFINQLKSAESLSDSVRNELGAVLRRHRGPFARSVLSLATQHYINTHKSRASIEQAVCSLLEIPYKHRPPTA